LASVREAHIKRQHSNTGGEIKSRKDFLPSTEDNSIVNVFTHLDWAAKQESVSGVL
jgi:hypothetical protein